MHGAWLVPSHLVLGWYSMGATGRARHAPLTVARSFEGRGVEHCDWRTNRSNWAMHVRRSNQSTWYVFSIFGLPLLGLTVGAHRGAPSAECRSLASTTSARRLRTVAVRVAQALLIAIQLSLPVRVDRRTPRRRGRKQEHEAAAPPGQSYR